MIKLKVKENRALFKRKRDNYGNKLRKKKVINYLRTELESSTTHGLPYIVNQDINSTERVFWLFSFMACLGLVIYLLSAQLARFIETPTVMSVEMDYFNWNVSYPAFTLCPLIKPDADAFTDIVNEINNNTGKDLRKYLWTIISANIRTLQILDLNPADIASIDPKDYVDIASRTFRKIPDDSLTTNTNQPISIDVAMTELGMCHVINSNVAVFHDPSKWSNSVMTMPYSKNNIELSVHNKDFFSQIMNYADVYEVLIHSPDETILSTTSSYTISKTGFISFGVQVWSSRISDVLRLTSVRLRRCRFIDEPISQRYPIYTYNHCMLECKIQMIINLCDCVPHFYKSLDHERICNISELKCVLNYKKEIMTLSVSEKTLRHKGYSDRLPRSPRDCACLNNCETDMYLKDYENFIPESTMTRLRIGISTFPKLRTVKDIIFSFNEIIQSDDTLLDSEPRRVISVVRCLKSGGVVNLCIGSSVLSLVEFILIFIRIPIANLLQKVKRRVFNN